MISIEYLQLWVLMQATVSTLCYKYWSLNGLLGSFIGAWIYIAFIKDIIL